MKNDVTLLKTDAATSRVTCPRCGHHETLGDLGRRLDGLRRRAGLGPEPVAGPVAPAGLHHDVCAACGTVYYPWVLREASRRRAEIARLAERQLAPAG